jgi:hypothetical protein
MDIGLKNAGKLKAFLSNPTDSVSIPLYHMVMIMLIILIKNIIQFCVGVMVYIYV